MCRPRVSCHPDACLGARARTCRAISAPRAFGSLGSIDALSALSTRCSRRAACIPPLLRHTDVVHAEHAVYATHTAHTAHDAHAAPPAHTAHVAHAPHTAYASHPRSGASEEEEYEDAGEDEDAVPAVADTPFSCVIRLAEDAASRYPSPR